MSRNVLKGLHRRALGVGNDNEVMAQKGFFAGGDGEPGFLLPSHEYVTAFEDFVGDTGAPGMFTYVENDTGAGAFTGVTTSATNGVYRITAVGGDGGRALTSDNNAAITGHLIKQWKLNSGGRYGSMFRMSTRLKISSISRTAPRLNVFVGLSDSGGAEMPIVDSGNGFDSKAADAVGFLFSPFADTGWTLIATKSTSGDSGDQSVVAGSSYGPTANVYTTLEMEYRTGISDTGGRMRFFIDGTPVGSIDSPVAAATAMVPWIGLFNRDTDTGILDVDYVAMSAARDTGE